jgi:hypothetical protein
MIGERLIVARMTEGIRVPIEEKRLGFEKHMAR